jgi:hypothetical protein
MRKHKSLFFILIVFVLSCADDDTFITDISDFDDLNLTKDSYWNGSDGTGFFIDGNKIYHNTYYPDWGTWSGFAYSNLLNTYYYNTESMYAVYADAEKEKSKNYAVAHQFEKIVISFKDTIKGEEPRSMQIANCTHTALAIKYGYGSAKKFGGLSGDDKDWLKVTITGVGLVDQITGQLDIFLADFRYDDNSKDYVMGWWRNVDLTDLGIVKRLEFEIVSSDVGTPLYFCIDNLKGRIHY